MVQKTKSSTLYRIVFDTIHKLEVVKQPHLVLGIRALPFNHEFVQRDEVLVRIRTRRDDEINQRKEGGNEALIPVRQSTASFLAFLMSFAVFVFTTDTTDTTANKRSSSAEKMVFWRLNIRKESLLDVRCCINFKLLD